MRDLSEIEELLVKFVEQLDEDNSILLAKEALNSGINPIYLLDLMNEGMKRVGKLYDCRDYYIADLIMSGLIFSMARMIRKLEKS